MKKQVPYIPNIPNLDYTSVQQETQNCLTPFKEYSKEKSSKSLKVTEISANKQKEYDEWYKKF
jgi:hypothetical protein